MVKYFLQIRQIFRRHFSVAQVTAIDRHCTELLREGTPFSKWIQSNIKQVLVGSFLLAHQTHFGKLLLT